MGETRIRQALELLRERGWCKGNFNDAAGRLCIEGALTDVWRLPLGSLGVEEMGKQDFLTLCAISKEHYGIGAPSLFNDRFSTTFADVELVMEKAAIMREEAVE